MAAMTGFANLKTTGLLNSSDPDQIIYTTVKDSIIYCDKNAGEIYWNFTCPDTTVFKMYIVGNTDFNSYSLGKIWSGAFVPQGVSLRGTIFNGYLYLIELDTNVPDGGGF